MFKCKVCLEKDSRITELKEQIQYFKSALHPPPVVHKYELEEDVVMNGGGQQVISQEDLDKEAEENIKIQREADGIFMGTYDEQYETPVEG